MNKVTLELCPLCGGQSDLASDAKDVHWRICCNDCGLVIFGDSEDEVVQKWNRRKFTENPLDNLRLMNDWIAHLPKYVPKGLNMTICMDTMSIELKSQLQADVETLRKEIEYLSEKVLDLEFRMSKKSAK